MKLNGSGIEELHKALLSAFTEPELQHLMLTKMDVDLHTVARGASYSEIVMQVIQWSERKERTSELVAAAREQNPNHSGLRLFTMRSSLNDEGSTQGIAQDGDKTALVVESEPTRSSLFDAFGRYQAFLIGLYAGVMLLFIGVAIGAFEEYAAVYFVVPLAGAILGFTQVRASGYTLRSLQALSPFMLSIGTLLWALGQLMWALEALEFGNPIPYPGTPDIFFVPGILSWLIGISLIYRLVGVDALQLTQIVRPWAIGIWFITLMAMFLFYIVAHGSFTIQARDPMKFLFDVFYPMVDALNFALVVALIISAKPRFDTLAPEMQGAMYVLLAAVIFNWAADVLLSTTSTLPDSDPWAFTNGNGVDWLFCTGVFLHGMAVLRFPIWQRRKYFKAGIVLD